MKLTDSELELFKLINKSIGKDLIAYIERVQTHVCDSRNWGPDETRESAQKVARILQENLIDKIKLQHEFKRVEPNQFR